MAKHAEGDSTSTALTVEQAGDEILRMAGESEIFEDEPESGEEKKAAPAGDEPEGSETEKLPEGEQEAGEGDEAAPAVRVIKASDGTEYEVPETLAVEFEKGALRQQDYTRKTQEAAELRRKADAELAEAVRERAALAASLTQVRKVLEAQTPPEPDWAKISAERPDDFPAEYAAWKLRMDRLEKLRRAEAEMQEKVLNDEKAQLERMVAEEQVKLKQAFPEWEDPDKGTKLRTQWVQYAQKLGYAPEDLAQIRDHRLLILLDKARRYDALKEKTVVTKAKPATGAPAPNKVRTLKPGGAQPAAAPVSEATKARMRLAKTGRAEDAAAAFIHSGLLD